MADENWLNTAMDNGIAVLEINRPPVNSYTTELLKELDAAVLDARFNDNVHAIVITGKVEKFFSAGADINMLSSKSLGFKNNFALHGHEVLMRLENTPKIVIAAINGHAVGGGLEIAMACDIRIAKKEGGRVGLAEINLGVMPGMGGTQRLPRLVGKARAMELCVHRQNHRLRRSTRHGPGPLHLRKRKLHGSSDGLCPPVHRAEQEQPRSGQSKTRDSNRSRTVVARRLGFRARVARANFRQRRRPGRRQSLSRKDERRNSKEITDYPFILFKRPSDTLLLNA